MIIAQRHPRGASSSDTAAAAAGRAAGTAQGSESGSPLKLGVKPPSSIAESWLVAAAEASAAAKPVLKAWPAHCQRNRQPLAAPALAQVDIIISNLFIRITIRSDQVLSSSCYEVLSCP